MFTVFSKETKTSFKVFDVWVATTSDYTKFLIFDEQWKWVDARDYVPEYINLNFNHD